MTACAINNSSASEDAISHDTSRTPLTSNSESSPSSNTSAPFSSSSEGTGSSFSQEGSEVSSSETSFSSEEETPIPEELVTPTLTFVNETTHDGERMALVSWPKQQAATIYQVQIDDEDFTTIETQHNLSYGKTMIVRALNEEKVSDWSTPFTFFGNPKVEDVTYKVTTTGYVWIYFMDADITPYQIETGATIIKPVNPTKDHHLFAGWYLDPFYTKEADFSVPVHSSMTLYAKWIKAAFIDNIHYWLRINGHITTSMQGPKRESSDSRLYAYDFYYMKTILNGVTRLLINFYDTIFNL